MKAVRCRVASLHRRVMLEGRLLLDAEGSRLEAFVDAGYASDATHPETRAAWPVGVGVGLWSATRAGLLGLDYGVGRGSPVLGGQVHLVLQTDF